MKKNGKKFCMTFDEFEKRFKKGLTFEEKRLILKILGHDVISFLINKDTLRPSIFLKMNDVMMENENGSKTIVPSCTSNYDFVKRVLNDGIIYFEYNGCRDSFDEYFIIFLKRKDFLNIFLKTVESKNDCEFVFDVFGCGSVDEFWSAYEGRIYGHEYGI